MNYQNIYNQIIERAQSENRKKVKGGEYYENHHIVPICLGGSNIKENKVLLTAREHFVCHLLLIEMHPGIKGLVFASWCMTFSRKNGLDRRVSSRVYERLKILHKLNLSGSGNPMFGKIGDLSPNKGKLVGELNFMHNRVGTLNPFFGKHHTDESKIKMSRLGTKASKETRLKMSVSRSKVVISEETKHRLSEALKGRIVSEETRKKSSEAALKEAKVCCPYCGKIRNKGIMIRWHFENCKQNPDYVHRVKRPKTEEDQIVCPYCGFKSTNRLNMSRYHNNNCKFKPA